MIQGTVVSVKVLGTCLLWGMNEAYSGYSEADCNNISEICRINTTQLSLSIRMACSKKDAGAHALTQ